MLRLSNVEQRENAIIYPRSFHLSQHYFQHDFQNGCRAVWRPFLLDSVASNMSYGMEFSMFNR